MAERKLLTEPVTRPDGITFTIEDAKALGDPKDNIAVSIPGLGLTHFYQNNAVLRFGLGDFSVGLARIGHTYYNAQTLGEASLQLDRELCDR